MIEPLSLPEVTVITGKVHCDDRGAFCETFRASALAEAGFTRPIVQENLVRTHRRGVLRGLHFQRAPFAQEKLVRVLSGSIFDVAVDIRPGSPTLGRWASAILSGDEPRQIFVPAGFAHGYLTLTDDCWVVYKTGAYYAPEAEAGCRWDDPAIAIVWPLPTEEISVNARDGAWPDFAEVVASLAG
ncbi:MAG: dTDP-4-dehydrorhamnose 3,5-epimerase [Caulobacteraceae bacterium]|nr:dTDP-4-dehydrorhamnose 3,5-epimerase [Caulobacteraceae bacterium]